MLIVFIVVVKYLSVVLNVFDNSCVKPTCTSNLCSLEW